MCQIIGNVVIDWYFEGKVVEQEIIDATAFGLEEDGERGSGDDKFIREMYIAFVNYTHDYKDKEGNEDSIELKGEIYLELNRYIDYCEFAGIDDNPHAEGDCILVEDNLEVS